jgi:hypothetical protein
MNSLFFLDSSNALDIPNVGTKSNSEIVFLLNGSALYQT